MGLESYRWAGIINNLHKYNNIEIPDNLKFIDFVDDPKNIYNKTKLIIFPSIFESYGRIVIEAALNKIPCLCSDLPGIREASYNLFEYSNVEQLNLILYRLPNLNCTSLLFLFLF